MDELKLNSVDDNQIIYINFESLEYNFIKTAKELDSYDKILTKISENYYLFLDEVQGIEDLKNYYLRCLNGELYHKGLC